MFQLNNNNCTRLDDERQNYIEGMFKWVDKYNEDNKKSHTILVNK